MAIKKSKKKQPPREQTQMPGTGRIDANPAIDKRCKSAQDATATREQAEADEKDAYDALTQILIEENDGKEYPFTGRDGTPVIAYVPKANQPKARIKKAKRAKPTKPE